MFTLDSALNFLRIYVMAASVSSAAASVSSATSIYEFTVKDIRGQDVSLTKYKGKVCLIVNVASE